MKFNDLENDFFKIKENLFSIFSLREKGKKKKKSYNLFFISTLLVGFRVWGFSFWVFEVLVFRDLEGLGFRDFRE